MYFDSKCRTQSVLMTLQDQRCLFSFRHDKLLSFLLSLDRLVTDPQLTALSQYSNNETSPFGL